jgi:hypothetical protein
MAEEGLKWKHVTSHARRLFGWSRFERIPRQWGHLQRVLGG